MNPLSDSNLSASNLKNAAALMWMGLGVKCCFKLSKALRKLYAKPGDNKSTIRDINNSVTSHLMGLFGHTGTAIYCLQPEPFPNFILDNALVSTCRSVAASILGEDPLSLLANKDNPFSDNTKVEIVFLVLTSVVLSISILESCISDPKDQKPAEGRTTPISDNQTTQSKPDAPPMMTRRERRRAGRPMLSEPTPAMPLSESLRKLESEYDTIKKEFEVGVDAPHNGIKELEDSLEEWRAQGKTINQKALEKKQERIKNAKAALNSEIISLQGKVNEYEKAINTYQESAFPHETDQLDELRSKVAVIRQRLEKVQTEMCPPDVPERA